jgi:hypothetical protein
VDTPRNVITPRKIEAFSLALRDRLRNGDPRFRKAYLQAVVDRIEVGDTEVRICGSTAALSRAVSQAEIFKKGLVPTSVQNWRPLGDSNPCFRRERATSWTARRRGRWRLPLWTAECLAEIVPAIKDFKRGAADCRLSPFFPAECAAIAP